MTTSNPEAAALLLPLTDTAIENCRNHLAAHPDTDAAVSAYLARHINSLMCAEIEMVVTNLIKARVRAGCNDAVTANLLNSLRRSIVRNAQYGEIRNSLKTLSAEIADRFELLVELNVGERGKTMLGNAVAKRNESAHERPPSVTFEELEQVYSVAVAIVKSAQEVLETA